MQSSDPHEIVIVGGGICGLATALALHREGIKSIVVEKSKTREAGAAITVLQNGWHALDCLGLSTLRDKAIALTPGSNVWLSNGMKKTIEVGSEGRCLKRIDLLRALADALPPGTLYHGSSVQSVHVITNSPYSTIHFSDGTLLNAKIVIGCDGVHSVVAKAVGLGAMKLLPVVATRGFTYYEKDGHGLPNSLNIWTSDKGTVGHVPVNPNLVYWFLTRKTSSRDAALWADQVLIKKAVMEAVKGYPSYVVDMLKNSDVESLIMKSIRYRPALDLLTSNFRNGTVVVAGDAMHAMAPFMAQGGSLSLEDAVVLATTLAPKLGSGREAIEQALDEFVEKRRMRVFWISWQTHLRGLSNIGANSSFIKWLSIFLLVVIFRDQVSHLRFDCRR